MLILLVLYLLSLVASFVGLYWVFGWNLRARDWLVFVPLIVVWPVVAFVAVIMVIVLKIYDLSDKRKERS